MDADNRHWQDAELVQRLYGLEPEGAAAAHLASCAECAARWERLQSRRAEVLAAPDVGEDLLRAQRQAVWAKIDQSRPAGWLGWKAPAAATTLVIALALGLNRPSPQFFDAPAESAAVETVELAVLQPVSDAQFFEEINALAASTEPGAAAPVRGLFSEGGN